MGPTETETRSARERGGERYRVILILFFVSNRRKRERERRKGFGLRDDDVPLMSSIMSQKNFQIEEIMVVVGKKSLLWR